MKRVSTIFLQAVVVLIALIALVIMIRMPLTEGRAKNLDLVHVYADPFIIFGYISSIAFFIALYKAFRLLGYIGRNNMFSTGAVSAIRGIKYCAIVLGFLIASAAVFIRIAHNKDDDPAGFLAMCIVLIFACIVIITSMAVFEKIVQKAIDMKSENDLTI